MNEPDAELFSVVADLIRICRLAEDHGEEWMYWRGAVCGAFENAMDRYNEEIRRDRSEGNPEPVGRD